MMYDKLLKEAENTGLLVKEKPLKSNKGRIKGNKIAIKKDMTRIEKACILAEELGHHYTSCGEIVNQKSISNRKQELRARRWSYDRLVSLRKLIQAFNYGCTNKYELAECLDVTEQYLEDALRYYENKYGLFAEVGDYCIYFNPLTVAKYNYK